MTNLTPGYTNCWNCRAPLPAGRATMVARSQAEEMARHFCNPGCEAEFYREDHQI